MDKLLELHRIIEFANPDKTGKEKSLADVLIASEKNKPQFLCVDSRGVLYHDYIKNPFVANPERRQRRSIIHGCWDLRKDSLDDQSQETIDFLASILLS